MKRNNNSDTYKKSILATFDIFFVFLFSFVICFFISPNPVFGINPTHTGSIEVDKNVYPVPFGSVGDFGLKDFDPTNNSITHRAGMFPMHHDVTINGLSKFDTVPNGTLVVHIRVSDADFDTSNGIDQMATTINGTNHGPVSIQISRNGESALLAYAGGPIVKPGKILDLNGTNLPNSVAGSYARDLGPLVEIGPNSGIFQVDLPIKITDGPPSADCPQVDNYESLNGTGFSTSQLVRFYSPTHSGERYCVMAGDNLTITYNDTKDASGNPHLVTKSATFDLRTGILQSDRSVYIISRDMILTLVEPDLNLDSQIQETIPLDLIEWDSHAFKNTIGQLGGQILAFDPHPNSFKETGKDTGIFQTIIKVPKKLAGNLLQRGEEIRLEYTDWGPNGSKIVGVNSQNIVISDFTSNFGALVELDQKVYTWTDRVYVTINAPDHNFDPNAIDTIGDLDYDLTVSTKNHKLSPYELEETGVDTGIFTGYVILTGNSTIKGVGGVDGIGKQPSGIGPNGSGPRDGFIPADNADGITVSFEYNKDQDVVGSALIRWNIGEIKWLDDVYAPNSQGTLQLVDPDMNLDPKTIDNFTTKIWSDSDPVGITLMMKETADASDIFNGVVMFSTTAPSSGNTLHVSIGDNVTGQYVDRTLPLPYVVTDQLPITAKTLIGFPSRSEPYHILLKSGPFTPTEGVHIQKIKDEHKTTDTVHFLLQFTNIPNSSELNDLANHGITLLDYITGNTYIASTKVSNLNYIQNITNVRWADVFGAEVKISPDLSYLPPPWAVDSNGRIILTIEVNEDGNLAVIKNHIIQLGGQVKDVVSLVPSVTASFNLGGLSVNDMARIIAQDDNVQFIDYVDPPLTELSNFARHVVHVDSVNETYHLSGENTRAFIFDGGFPHQHVDLSQADGHVIILGRNDPITAHATNVAGVFGGTGLNSITKGGTSHQWAGMAPKAIILAGAFRDLGGVLPLNTDGGSLQENFTSAITNQADLISMSLGFNAYGPTWQHCDLFGKYSHASKLIDRVVNGSINHTPTIFVEAVGNNREDLGIARPPDCPMFASVDPPSPAKNSIAVGAISSDNKLVMSFSSFGPTADYRLKPDIVAPGGRMDFPFGVMTTTDFVSGHENDYSAVNGTSISTPVVSGSIALLIEKWRQLHGVGTIPMPSTVKAILIHTANDSGNPGPDYQYGWGILDTKAAIDLLINDATDHLINTSEIKQRESHQYQFLSDGTHDVKTTLVWDDLAGTRLPTVSLINDLDMMLKDPDGKIYKPFVLNHEIPQQNATEGNDTINNVEMSIGKAKQGVWTVLINGTTVLRSQNYTLLTSEGPSTFTNSSQFNLIPATLGGIHIGFNTEPIVPDFASPTTFKMITQDDTGLMFHDVIYVVTVTDGVTTQNVPVPSTQMGNARAPFTFTPGTHHITVRAMSASVPDLSQIVSDMITSKNHLFNSASHISQSGSNVAISPPSDITSVASDVSTILDQSGSLLESEQFILSAIDTTSFEPLNLSALDTKLNNIKHGAGLLHDNAVSLQDKILFLNSSGVIQLKISPTLTSGTNEVLQDATEIQQDIIEIQQDIEELQQTILELQVISSTPTATFDVTVPNDLTSPTIIVPPDQVLTLSSGTTSTVVTYPPATASDPDDPASPPVCFPSSGSVFPVPATTHVICTSHDTHGHTTTAQFDVKTTNGCLIATAAYGSEVTPQLQFLMDFRDNHLLLTKDGLSFMTVFNTWYYSFSPAVADYERSHPWSQSIVRGMIYPLLGILMASEKVFSMMPGEYGTLSAGFVASSLVGSVYFLPFVLLIPQIRNNNRLNFRFILFIFGIIFVATLISILVANSLIMMITTPLFVISLIGISAIMSARAVVILGKKFLNRGSRKNRTNLKT